ncbi:hypothetical protein AB1L42_16105 [Thalassoglobus sp. JC818]|uniref:hypothetical protein n=1 Tax=Thalassoglobus sp. JC818 TaxID=3232136 RepID=UPI0034596DB6
MYPPDELPESSFIQVPLDWRFYPDDAWAALAMAKLEQPPSDVTNERLFQVAADETIHKFWRSCAVAELFYRQAEVRRTLLAAHHLFTKVSIAAQFRLLFDFSSFLRHEEVQRE